MRASDLLKGIAGLLLALVFIEILGLYSDVVFAPPTKVVGGYALPGGPETASAKPAAAAAEVPLPQLLAKADPAKGEADAKICATCHSLEKGGAIKVGPPLWGVVGRPKGSIPGFAYSDGLKAKGGDWAYEDLNQMITKPSAFIKGSKMTFPGEASPEKRADILAYLRTLSDNPVPFPK
ncbi:MAG: c-type cytochrome [Roseiarcus sp.]